MAVHRFGGRSRHGRLGTGLAVLGLAAAAVGVGIGTADAGTRQPGARRPAPTVTAVTSAPTAVTSAPTRWAPPPANAGFDYQIGEAYPPPAGVTVVTRDRAASPAAGTYSVCYVNAFQAQPDAASWWQAHHPELLLRDAAGKPVVDKDWDEILLDFSTEAKRAALTEVVGGWIDGCAAKGFAAVEPDNLDSWTRSGGRLTRSAAVAYAASLVSRAHGRGLAVGQKNAADLGTADARRIGFDFAVAEECADYDECDAYTDTYGGHVLVIEYTRAGFTKACRAYGGSLSIVLRDVDVTAPGSGSYVFQTC